MAVVWSEYLEIRGWVSYPEDSEGLKITNDFENLFLEKYKRHVGYFYLYLLIELSLLI